MAQILPKTRGAMLKICCEEQWICFTWPIIAYLTVILERRLDLISFVLDLVLQLLVVLVLLLGPLCPCNINIVVPSEGVRVRTTQDQPFVGLTLHTLANHPQWQHKSYSMQKTLHRFNLNGIAIHEVSFIMTKSNSHTFFAEDIYVPLVQMFPGLLFCKLYEK